MVDPVFILGGSQSDFARSLTRDGRGLKDLTHDTVHAALQQASLDARDIASIHVANAFGELFTGQAQLGAMPATAVPELWGVPAMRHEGACASGSLAVLAAMSEIEAGRYDCVLVLGLEQERNVPGDVAARYMGAAAHAGHEGQDARFLWPAMFARIADAYAERHGLRHEHLAAIARKNFANAARNPLAQTRGWRFTDTSFTADDTANPVVEGRLRRQDCSQVTDGAAAVVLASARFAAAHAARTARPLSAFGRIAGWGHRTVGLSLAEKLHRAEDGYLFPHVRAAAADAYRRANIPGPAALSGIETHDCFTISEYMAIDHLGITAPGESWRAIEAGMLELGGALPVNPSGGLIGGGHPVGATGVRMLFDAHKQVTGAAEACQIAGADRLLTFNLGGSTTTSVCLIVETGAP
jgi:acetyl-CoA C-acetyltransferase